MTMPNYEEFGEALAPIERLAARVPDGITTDDEILLAQEMLLQASDEVRAHGRPWTRNDVPAAVVSIVISAAARGYMNPALYEEEDADAVSFKRGVASTKGVELTPGEVRRVKMAASRSGFGYIPASKPSSWQPRSLSDRGGRTGYVPLDSQYERWFPFFSDSEPGRVF